MNIYALNTLAMGRDTLDMIKDHIDIRGVIGLSDRKPGDGITGFEHMEAYCDGNGLEFVEVSSYGLGSGADREKLLKLDIDVLLVLGWQRLVPEWLIRHCKVCAVGCHGSAYGITAGRGRSPENWALIMGEKEFSLSIFIIDGGADSGAVLDTREFPIDDSDDINSLRFKVSRHYCDMLIGLYGNGLGKARGRAQTGTVRYLPKREPSDSEIDWRRGTIDVYNFIRALYRPFPCAFSRLGRDEAVRVLRASPLPWLDMPGKCGEVVAMFGGGFVVRTGDGGILVSEYECSPPDLKIGVGTMLVSYDFRTQMRDIIDRHRAKHPSDRINEKLARLGGN